MTRRQCHRFWHTSPVTPNSHQRQIPPPPGSRKIRVSCQKHAKIRSQPATYRPADCSPHRRTNETQRHTAQADRERSARTQEDAPGTEHTPRNRRTHQGSQTSRAPPWSARGGTSARAHTQTHSDTHTHTHTHTHRRSHICNAYGKTLPQPVTSSPPSSLAASCPRLTPAPRPSG